MSRRELKITESEYRVKIKGQQFYRYELAGKSLPEDWYSRVRNEISGKLSENPQWQEYQDPGKGTYRSALIVDNHLEDRDFYLCR